MSDATLTRGRPRAAVNREENLLEVDNLTVTFARKGSRPVHAVDGVSFEVRPGPGGGHRGGVRQRQVGHRAGLMGLLPSRGVEISGRSATAADVLGRLSQ